MVVVVVVEGVVMEGCDGGSDCSINVYGNYGGGVVHIIQIMYIQCVYILFRLAYDTVFTL